MLRRRVLSDSGGPMLLTCSLDECELVDLSVHTDCCRVGNILYLAEADERTRWADLAICADR